MMCVYVTVDMDSTKRRQAGWINGDCRSVYQLPAVESRRRSDSGYFHSYDLCRHCLLCSARRSEGKTTAVVHIVFPVSLKCGFIWCPLNKSWLRRLLQVDMLKKPWF